MKDKVEKTKKPPFIMWCYRFVEYEPLIKINKGKLELA